MVSSGRECHNGGSFLAPHPDNSRLTLHDAVGHSSAFRRSDPARRPHTTAAAANCRHSRGHQGRGRDQHYRQMSASALSSSNVSSGTYTAHLVDTICHCQRRCSHVRRKRRSVREAWLMSQLQHDRHNSRCSTLSVVPRAQQRAQRPSSLGYTDRQKRDMQRYTDRQTERQRQTQTHTHTDIDRQTDRQRHIKRRTRLWSAQW